MPEEITAVVSYLRNGAPAPTLVSRPLPPGDVVSGGQLFARNCLGCHGTGGRGGIAPEIGNPVFQSAASDDFIVQTIRNGRANTAMPAFQRPEAPSLSDQDIADVLAYLREVSRPRERKQVANTQHGSQPSGGR